MEHWQALLMVVIKMAVEVTQWSLIVEVVEKEQQMEMRNLANAYYLEPNEAKELSEMLQADFVSSKD